MTSLLQLLLLVGIWAMVLISPGPHVLVTARYATARSRREGVLVGLGVPSATGVWASASLFTAVLPPHLAVWLQVSVIAGMLLMATAWFAAVACLFSLAPVARGYRRAKRGIDAVTGCLFVALASRLATE